jgi:hypothetical protein
MTKNYIFSFLYLLSFISAYSQQQVENPGFESWEDVGLAVDEPINWSSIKTSDGGAFINGFAPYVWDKSTDAHSGAYSVKLYNNEVIGIIAAGTVTNGRIHAEATGTGWAFTDTGDDRWNTPFTERPDSVAVWVKYAPAGTDDAQLKVVLHSGSAKIPDATQTNYIAVAEISVPNEISTWTRFSAPFNYISGADPEYILMVASAADESATIGSEAYFDDLELIYNPVTLDLKAYMQGPYKGGNVMSTFLNPNNLPLNQPFNMAPWNYYGSESVASIPNTNVVDWVLVEIRDASSANAANSFASIGRQAGFLMRDGSIVGLDGNARLAFDVTINQNLFAIVWHRNHLGIMSAYPLTLSGGFYTYDYSNAVDKIHGSALGKIEIETGVWGMVSGDGDANGMIEPNDKNSFWSILVGSKGYLSSDYNMDGQINNEDKNDYWLDNLTKDCQVPN